MKQILIVSGKGGTGKTTLTGTFAFLAKNKIMVDCDVDAADLHLLLQPRIKEKHEFKSGKTAILEKEKCMRCGECRTQCKFDAIQSDYTLKHYLCEGCGFCFHMCRFGAIKLEEKITGEWFVSETKYGTLVHAKLRVAEENSGKLVSVIKKAAIKKSEENFLDYVIIDGPPGIGCAVMASMTGVDIVIIITEPTLSGIHDAKRVIELAKHFKIPVNLVINKFDINLDMTKSLEELCLDHKIPVIGKIPYDKIIIESIVKGVPVMEIANGKIKDEFINIWNNIKGSN